MNARTICVSNNKPNVIVVSIWPSTQQVAEIERRHGDCELQARCGHHTEPMPAMDRLMPVLIPAWISSLNREMSNRRSSLALKGIVPRRRRWLPV